MQPEQREAGRSHVERKTRELRAGEREQAKVDEVLADSVWRFSAMRVLLVEDDEGVASALAELLGHAGASHSHRPRRRRPASRQGLRFVVVGPGVARYRRPGRAARAPARICCTGDHHDARDSDGAVVLGLRAGADDYLVKPVRKAVLLARIEAVMRWLRRVAGDVSPGPGRSSRDLSPSTASAGKSP